MPNIVLDTNVFVSALVFGGVPRELLDRVLVDQVEVTTSPALVEEFLGILRTKFLWTSAECTAAQEWILNTCTLVRPSTIIAVLKDETDNRVLEAAIEGECDTIVTGDKAFLELGSYKGIAIVSVREFLEGESATR